MGQGSFTHAATDGAKHQVQPRKRDETRPLALEELPAGGRQTGRPRVETGAKFDGAPGRGVDFRSFGKAAVKRG